MARLNPLDSKEIKPVNPKENQPLIFIWRTDAKAWILRPLDVKSWLIWNDPDVGKDWRQEEKGTTEDELVRWHHWLNDLVFSSLLNFPQFVVIYTVKVFSVVSEAEVDFFLIPLLFLWSNGCWQFDLWFLCLF